MCRQTGSLVTSASPPSLSATPTRLFFVYFIGVCVFLFLALFIFYYLFQGVAQVTGECRPVWCGLDRLAALCDIHHFIKFDALSTLTQYWPPPTPAMTPGGCTPPPPRVKLQVQGGGRVAAAWAAALFFHCISP